MSEELRVWLVDDDASIRWVLERALRNGGMSARAFEAAEGALEALRRDTPDVLITDIRMPGASGLELLKRIRDARPALPVIVMTAHSDLGSAVSAYEGGAFEYLPKPFDIDQAVALVRRAASGAGPAGADSAGTPRIPELLGKAPAMQQVFRAIGRLARSSVTVLITGESGTGKELVARALHEHSPRSSRPFVALNTAAIPADLLESELFGHERGAFTGADAQRRGRFEQADGGTLFLDEIGDMSMPLQTRLLRVLAEGEFYRVGGQVPIRVDVRVIAATNAPLLQRADDGAFRRDLYYRLSVFPLHIPPLRERRQDIIPLAQHFLRQIASKVGKKIPGFSREALRYLTTRQWQGNVRELQNAIERAVIVSAGNLLTSADFRMLEPPGADGVNGKAPVWQLPDDGVDLPALNRALITEALQRTGYNVSAAARLLGFSRPALRYRMKKYGLVAVDGGSPLVVTP